MRVLFLDQFSELGGAQRVLLDTVCAARERGWSVRVALPGNGPLVDQLRSSGFPIVPIACGPYRSGSKSLGDLLRFSSDLRQQRRVIGALASETDLIYVNGPRLLPAAALVSRGRIPILFHAHSHVHGLARRMACGSIRRSRATVIACSQSVLDVFREGSRAGAVMPNGIAEIPFRERHGISRIGIIGRIHPDKGQLEFVRAASLLHSEFPGLQFIICGAPQFSDSAYLRSVKELAQGLPVEFLGWRDDIGAVLSELDLLVVPSKQEGMGRVIVEAFSAGVPVLASAVGGIPEIIEDGVNGYLMRERSPDAMAQRITQIVGSDPAPLRRLAANARRDWERSYNLTLYQQRVTQVMACLSRQSAHETEELPLHK